jgi:hypothetical protein
LAAPAGRVVFLGGPDGGGEVVEVGEAVEVGEVGEVARFGTTGSVARNTTSNASDLSKRTERASDTKPSAKISTR